MNSGMVQPMLLSSSWSVISQTNLHCTYKWSVLDQRKDSKNNVREVTTVTFYYVVDSHRQTMTDICYCMLWC